jgi:cardiolipin synthase (CMP-forming)
MARAESGGGTDPPGGTGGPPFRETGERPRGGRLAARRSRISHVLGWASWPFFVWRPHPAGGSADPPGGGDPGVVRSIVHTGYALSAVALAIDLGLWRGLFLPGALLFLLGHLVWISAVGSLLLLNSGFLQRLDGRPLERLGLANLLTVVRASFLPLLLYLLWLGRWTAAVGVYVALGLTDVVDGAVARRRHEESKLGFILDPFVDIFFHLGVLLSLWAVGVLSWLTGALVAARYLLLLGGCGVLYLAKGEIWIQPTPFGKMTGLSISALTGVLLLLLGLDRATPVFRHGIDRGLAIIFAATVLHVLVIGRTNFRRPPEGGTAVYRRGWGLLLGRELRGRDGDGERDGRQ